MIIKSMSRKDPSFGQLVKYMETGADENFIYSHNIYSTKSQDIEKEFEENYKHLKRQKNSNALYHEIISITKSSARDDEQKQKLIKIADEYIKARANNCLVYGRIHEADNNFHLHLMISSNGIEQNRNHYLNKKDFSEVKKGLERYVLKEMPELKQVELINQPKKYDVISQKEFELKKRTGKITKKETIQYKLTQIFLSSNTRDQFLQQLRDNKIEIYLRGKNIGFKDLSDDKQRKYRLNKLGLSDEFNKMSEIIAKELEENQNPKQTRKTVNQEIPKEEKQEKRENTKEEANYKKEHFKKSQEEPRKANTQKVKPKKEDKEKNKENKQELTKEEKALRELQQMRENRKYMEKEKTK